MSNSSPLVSVIVPVYNAERYLKQSLDSICRQTLKNIEIILVDDGSTDESFSIISDYASKDSRIIVLQQQNKYAGVARNNGMKIAKGKYLSFLDADDYFEEDMLQSLTEAAEVHEVDVVLCAADVYREADGRIIPAPWLLKTELLENADLLCFNPPEVLGDRLYEIVKLAPWNKLFRADFVRQYSLQWSQEPRANDVLFVGSALAAAKTMAAVPRPLIHYRIHKDSISHSKNKSTAAHVTAFSALKQSLLHLHASDEIMHSYNLRYMSALLWDCDTLDMDEARKFRQYIIDEIEPKEQLLSLPCYDNAARIPIIEYRYKSMVRPLVSLLCVETGNCEDTGWKSLLAEILTVKDAAFDIICISESEESSAGCIFKTYERKDIRCSHVTGNVTEKLQELLSCNPDKYYITMSPKMQLNTEEFRSIMHKLEENSLKKATYSYYRIKKEVGYPPKVSIIVPVYSGKEHFGELIDCLRNQTLKDIEIIFIDDKGSDGCFELAQAAAAEDDRIVLLRNESNVGPGVSRNRGIEAARGEFIAFADSDDYVSPNFYEVLYADAILHHALVVKGACCHVFDDGTIKESPLNASIQKRRKPQLTLLNSFTSEHWSAIYSRDFVLKTGARNNETSRYGEDTHFLMMLTYHLKDEGFYLDNSVSYYYRQQDGSLMHSKKESEYFTQMKRRTQARLAWVYGQADTPELTEYTTNIFEAQLGWILDNALQDGAQDEDINKYLQFTLDELNVWKASGRAYKPGILASALIELKHCPYHFCSLRKVYKRLTQVEQRYDPLLRELKSLREYSTRLTKQLDMQKKEQLRLNQELETWKKQLRLMLLMPQLLKKYRLLKLKKFFSWGSRRKRYKQKIAELRVHIREYRQLLRRQLNSLS